MHKKANPFVSVIVPVYNAGAFLTPCLDSLAGQTFDDYEVIVIDDGSTDGSSAACDTYASQHPQFTVIHQKNAGQTRARRKGVAKATGRYIAFVDSDDWVEPDFLEVLCGEAKKHDADIVTCDTYYNFTNRQITARQRVPAGCFDKAGLVRDIYPMMIFSGEYFHYGVYAAMWNKLVRRELVVKNIAQVSSAIKIGEDGATTFANFLDANTVCVLHEKPLYHYRINDASITQSYCAEQFSGAKILAKTLRAISDDRQVYDLNSQIDYYFSHYVRFTFNEEFLYKNDKTFRERRDYLRSVFLDPEVVAVVERLDIAKLSPDARQFFVLLKHKRFNELLRYAFLTAYKQRARRIAHKLLKRY